MKISEKTIRLAILALRSEECEAWRLAKEFNSMADSFCGDKEVQMRGHAEVQSRKAMDNALAIRELLAYEAR